MERDSELFPPDQTGDTLWSMLQAGDDLNQVREIEFSVIFPDQSSALQFGQFLLENNQKLSFSPYSGSEAFPWEITAYPEMPALYGQIVAYQQLLETHCGQFHGEFDGWYCQSQSFIAEH